LGVLICVVGRDADDLLFAIRLFFRRRIDKPRLLDLPIFKCLPVLRRLIAAAGRQYNGLAASEDNVIVTVGALGGWPRLVFDRAKIEEMDEQGMTVR
jgi:hypothetical protein